MKVYRATPRGHGSNVGVLVEVGRMVDTAAGYMVELPNGDRQELDGWHHTKGAAWEAAGDELESLARQLQDQADGCRVRAAEEVVHAQ
jgi:hypothetical protein